MFDGGIASSRPSGGVGEEVPETHMHRGHKNFTKIFWKANYLSAGKKAGNVGNLKYVDRGVSFPYQQTRP